VSTDLSQWLAEAEVVLAHPGAVDDAALARLLAAGRSIAFDDSVAAAIDAEQLARVIEALSAECDNVADELRSVVRRRAELRRNARGVKGYVSAVAYAP
jgi:hypothetical protein